MFDHAFSGFRLRGLELRNRLVSLPAGTSLVEGGLPTSGDVEHVERLAEGGVGLIITGAAVVHPSSYPRGGKLVAAYLEEVVPPMRHKAEAAHRHGAFMIGQLVHLGREGIGAEADVPSVAPSAVRTARDAYPPHVLTSDEIRDQVDAWGLSARHLERAGLDGVEIHAAHGYLVAQFMSSATNLRTDEHGGDLAGRLRFLDEVIDAIRRETGPDFVLGVRLSAEEEVSGGTGIDHCLLVAEHLAARGDVDYLSITHGTRGSYVKDSTGPDAVAVESAARVRAATGLPVLVGQRIRDAGTADTVVRTGKADLVGMARALIADPELPAKSRDSRLDEVRSCIGVNQDCRAFDPHLHCAVNAEVGRGRHPGLTTPIDRPREVHVVGAGPAGLEAARVAALRGHRVTLYEAATSTGGALRLAAAAPHRAALLDVVDHLEREVRRLRVDVHLGAPISRDDLVEIHGIADDVVLATGAVPGPAPDAAAGRRVLSVEDVLAGAPVPVGRGTALVYDESDGFWPVFNAAESLARSGWSVHVATALTACAPRVPHESQGPLLTRLASGGARVTIGHRLEASGDGWALAPVFGGPPVGVEPDLVVWHRDRAVTDSFGSAGLVRIGDCVAPRRIGHAIADGYRVGASLGLTRS
ncbi:FAD-dependent oxidoreductase [Aeromicrobium endophyticum]|uniref:NADH:flavin oxidoreductase n=1 Tax=Aeromicrobium endophyticum TaxID=2292704 RepID=A0A371P9W0_9ACTN|nr:FAD-dependent oxidoreductase [Aeromicrobium endophyticum]REK72682.1 NADH:flavin oxidoreductase [Aeromicrobium endophyticum]